MYEHRDQPLLPRPAFLWRMVIHSCTATAIVLGSLLIGMTGYHFFEGLGWLDAFVNAAMLLGGMGPVNVLHTSAGKVFAGLYALYAGLVFIAVAGLLFTPLIHRFFHKFHLDSLENKDTE